MLVWTPPPVLGNRFLTIIQAKRFDINHKVGSPIIRDLQGATINFNADRGQIITTSDFSKPAIKTAERSPKKIDLIRFFELVNKLNEYLH